MHMTSFRVAITIRSFDQTGPVVEKLKKKCSIVYVNTTGRRLSEEQLTEVLRDADAAIAGTEIYSKNVLFSAKHLRAVSRVGVGLDTIDMTAAAERKIRIFTTPEAPAQAVAEHTLALIFSCLRHIPNYNERLRQGNYSVLPGSLLAGKTAGIIGLGRIGTRVATILDAIGCSILYYDPYITYAVPDSWGRAEELSTLLSRSDIITLHMPPQAGNKPILNRQAFMACKNGVIVINTARGSLIDEDELVRSIEEGIVAGAGIDVANEPVSGSLLGLPQVILTPHVASNTVESRYQMEMEAVDNILHFIEEDKT